MVKKWNSRKKYIKRKRLFRTKEKPGFDSSYGDQCEKPDITPEELQKEKEDFLEKLKKSAEEIKSIQELTKEQSDSDLWHLERRKRLTASNFHAICSKFSARSNGNTMKLVEQLLYPAKIHSASIDWGKQNEKRAINALENLIDEEILPCGLFISGSASFLAATPDGLIGEKGIIEIKCPFSAKNITPEEGIINRKISFWKKNGEINQNHKWFYQIQGQLLVTGRAYCCFAVWTPFGIKKEIILKNDVFCEKMKMQLTEFYMKCYLPELVDSRKCRSMPIRNISLKST